MESVFWNNPWTSWIIGSAGTCSSIPDPISMKQLPSCSKNNSLLISSINFLWRTTAYQWWSKWWRRLSSMNNRSNRGWSWKTRWSRSSKSSCRKGKTRRQIQRYCPCWRCQTSPNPTDYSPYLSPSNQLKQKNTNSSTSESKKISISTDWCSLSR